MTEPKKEPYLIDGLYGWFYLKKLMRRSINSVDLTHEQATKVNELIKAHNKKTKPLKDTISKITREMKEEIAKVTA